MKNRNTPVKMRVSRKQNEGKFQFEKRTLRKGAQKGGHSRPSKNLILTERQDCNRYGRKSDKEERPW